MNKKILGLMIILLFFASQGQAARLYTWGQAEDISLDTDTNTLHSFDGFDYKFKSDGTFRIFKDGIKQASYGFGMSGIYNSNTVYALSNDYEWVWEIIENNSNRIELEGKRANYDSVPFKWKINLVVERYKYLKMTNYVENTTAKNVSDLQFFYLFDVNTVANPVVKYVDENSIGHQYSYHTNQLREDANGLSDILNRVSVPFFDFQFQDMIDEGYNLTYLFFGDLNFLNENLPDSNGFVVGFSKDDGILAAGTGMEIDPILIINDTDDASMETSIDLGCTGTNSTTLISGIEVEGCSGHQSFHRSLFRWNFDSFQGEQVKEAAFNLIIKTSTIGDANTCTFDLNKIVTTWLSSNVISMRLATDNPLGSIIDNWFDESVSMGLIVGDITSEFNLVIADDNTVFSMGVVSDSDSVTVHGDCRVRFCDTGETFGICSGDGSTDPFIDYNISFLPDVNISAIEGIAVGNVFRIFSSTVDGNLQIDLNVMDFDTNSLILDLNVSTSNTEGSGSVIVKDLNLSKLSPIGSFSCEDTDFTNVTSCSVDLNIDSDVLSDNNYFILARLYAGIGTDFSVTTNSFQVDSSKPTTAWDKDTNSWYTSNQTVALTCYDDGSGCLSTKYRLDTDSTIGVTYGAWQAYTVPFAITDDGSWALDFNSTDVIGNVGDTNTMFLFLDKTAPVTDHNAFNWETEWFSADVNINFFCNENNREADANSGCSLLSYGIVGDTNYWIGWGTDGNIGIPITADGNTEIFFYSNDTVDNNETSTYLNIGIDLTAPSTSWDGDHNAWKIVDQNIHLTCHDESSGCLSTKYRLDTNKFNGISWGEPQVYDTNILITADGNWAIDFNSTDNVGHEGDTNTFYVLIDKTVPTTHHPVPSISIATTTANPTFTLGVKDINGSGLTHCTLTPYVSTDQGVSFTAQAAIEITPTDTYDGSCEWTTIYAMIEGYQEFVTIVATDKAGNNSVSITTGKYVFLHVTEVIEGREVEVIVYPPYCGDGTCNPSIGETSLSCPGDCPSPLEPLPPLPPQIQPHLGKIAPGLLGTRGPQQIIVETTTIDPALMERINALGFCPELTTEFVTGGVIDGQRLAELASFPEVLTIQPTIKALNFSASITQVSNYLNIPLVPGKGKGIGIAILDSGANCELPEIRCDIKRNLVELEYGLGECIPKEGSGIVWDFIGHGTSINHIIHSMSPEAKIAVYKVCDETGCDTMKIIKALDIIRKDPTIQVINLSFGISKDEIKGMGIIPEEYILNKEINRVINAGKIVIAAAGNCSGLQYLSACPSTACEHWGEVCPASCVNDIISVGGINFSAENETLYGGFPDDTIACFSSQGNVTVVAPAFIKATNQHGTIRNAIGTSFSAPVVTAIVANTISETPITTPLFYTNSAIVKMALQASAKDLGLTGIDDIFGAGLIQADKIDIGGTANTIIIQQALIAIGLAIVLIGFAYYFGFKGLYKKALIQWAKRITRKGINIVKENIEKIVKKTKETIEKIKQWFK